MNKKLFCIFLLSFLVCASIFAQNTNYNDYLNDSSQNVGYNIKDKFQANPKKKGAPPKWIKTFPKDNQYFTGIGSASYTGNIGEDINNAINQALVMIGSQIETKISSSSTLNEMSVEKTINGKTSQSSKEQFASQIKSFVKMTFDGVELVDTWYNEKKGVYAYCRLSIEKYNQLYAKKLQIATTATKNNFSDAMNAFEASDYKKAFILFATIAGQTFPFPTEIISVDYNGRQYNATTESQNKLKQLTSMLSYKVHNKSTQTIKDTVGSFVYTLTINNQPIEGLPIYFVNASSRQIVYTNNEGEFAIDPTGVTSTQNKIFYGIDIETICQSSSLDSGDYIALENALYTTRSIIVRQSGLEVYIDADDSLTSCVNVLQEYLTTKYNSKIVNDVNKSLFVIKLSSNIKPFPQNNSKFRIAEGSLTLQLKHNIKDSKNIFSVTFDVEKENGLSESQAISNVIEAFADGLSDSYRTQLEEEFDKLNISIYTIEE